MANPMLYAILAAAGLLAIGLALRLRLRLFRILYIPAAVIAGAMGLALVQLILRTGGASLDSARDATKSIVAEWSTWPAMLIAVVFAALLLEKPQAGGFGSALQRGVRSGILAWIIILGQILVGLIVYVALVRPVNPNVPTTFSQLLEISWAGGHGSSAAMGNLYANQGFSEGKDLAFFSATVGLIYGVLSGLVLVNLAIRRGWTGRFMRRSPTAIDLNAGPAGTPIAFGRVGGEVIEPIVLPILILAAAFGMGLLLQRGFLTVATLALGADDPANKTQVIDAAANVPLFLFTLLGGWIVRKMTELLGIHRFVDTASLQRIVGVAMEFLIVAGIATMRIESISQFGVSLLVLLLLAAVWSVICLLVLARLLLPKPYWFELGLLNYGFSTANTPQGMMLLRIIDPDLRSNATTDYAIAAPLSAPFIGGGVITFLVLPMAFDRIAPLWMALILLLVITLLITAGLSLAKRDRQRGL